MSILRTKRSRTIVIGVVAALIVAGGAIAFWTASGTGCCPGPHSDTWQEHVW